MISFFQEMIKQKKQQIKKIEQKITFPRVNKNSLEEREEKKISWRTLSRGSMTVEAALIMPIFLFAVLNMLSIVEIVRVQANIQAAMYEVNKEMVVYGYAFDHITKEMDIETGNITSEVLAHTLVKSRVNEIAGETYLNHSMIQGGGGGIYYIRSDIMEEDDMIDLLATYRVTPFYKIAAFSDIKMANRCRMHAWVGYTNTDPTKSAGENEEVMVYVAEYASVYHKTPTCTHLKLSIHATNRGEVREQKNIYEQKYTPCERCGYEKNGDILYITDMGDRYHTSLGCSGLKRTISVIPISKVGNLPPCSKCG